MGFCRRCGDIVVGTKCKCGGTAVAPVVAWNQGKAEDSSNDPWSRTYVARDPSPTRMTTASTTSTSTPTTAPPDPARRFPRPATRSNTAPQPRVLGNRISAHIASTTSQLTRPSSPLKQSVAAPEADILPSPSPYDKSLSKVYGSVLQSTESLATHACALCASTFPPDATIYPDPAGDNARFLCRPCFTTSGGSKGNCPTCSRPVLALKSEGGFIEVDGKCWHKRCFNCEGCFKHIGDAPMVDLLGRPSCPECFDNCLKRDRTPKKRESTNLAASPATETIGRKSREGSPAIAELEMRLGISKSRESSPSVEASTRFKHSPRMSASGAFPSYTTPSNSPSTKASPPKRSLTTLPEPASPTPASRGKYGHFKPSNMSRRSVDLSTSPSRSSTNSPDTTPQKSSAQKALHRMSSPAYSPGASDTSRLSSPRLDSPETTPQKSSAQNVLHRISGPAYSPAASDTSRLSSPRLNSPPTPELMYDFSDTATVSSYALDSPSVGPSDAYTVQARIAESVGDSVSSFDLEEARKPSPRASFPDRVQQPLSQNTCCAKCRTRLFSLSGGGRYVTVPTDEGVLEHFHSSCFNCAVCALPFKEAAQGQAIFVKGQYGPSHLECAPPKRASMGSIPSSPSRKTSVYSPSSSPGKSSPVSSPSRKTTAPSPGTQTSTSPVSSRYQRPTVTTTAIPRFGGSSACPGCHLSVSPMERGVVPGPQGTRWHAACLVCGGKQPTFAFRRPARNPDEPGCGKRLDSAAKTDGDGGVWCRECLLLLSNRASPQHSPTRSPLIPNFTGMQPQLTGTTTLVRQFTGMGSNEGSLLRQMTGTRSVSPTKQFGDAALLRQLTGGGMSPTRSISPTKQLGLRPRPKSVIGSRSKSIDEGRGMFLVRQMTGSKS